METTLITGKTFPVKDALRALGGVWDAAAKGWRVPATNADLARSVVAAGPVAPRRAPRSTAYADARRHHERYQSHHYTFSGGGEAYRNKNGRCEDAPACGCCSF